MQELHARHERLHRKGLASDTGKITRARAARSPDGRAELRRLHAEHSIARSRPSLAPRSARVRWLPEPRKINHEWIRTRRRRYEKGHVDLVATDDPGILCRNGLVTAI